MSATITDARIVGFNGSVHHLSQQGRSLLEARVRTRPGMGKVEYFERLSPSNMSLVTTRHGDTVWNDIEHSRRAAYKADYSWAQPVDEEDQLEILIDPVGEYAMAASAAVGRRIDQTVVNALYGNAATGEAGGGAVATLTNSQTSAALSLSRIATGLQTLYDRGVVVSPGDFTYVHNPKSLAQAINDSAAAGGPFTSTDYTQSEVMHAGAINVYMGFSWIMLPDAVNNAEFGILPALTATTVGTYMFHRNALGLSIWNRVSASIDKRPDKNNTTQILVKTSLGAVRVEEELVADRKSVV